MSVAFRVPERLLAKGLRADRPPLTLEQHLLDTETAAIALFREGSRWGDAFPRFFRLNADERRKFLPTLRVAALAHDIGKANADFARAMVEPGVEQTLRHEHLSAIFLHHEPYRRWLGASARVDFDSVAAAVATHHLKTADDGDYKLAQPRSAPDTRVFFEHPEVTRILHKIGEVAEIGPPPSASIPGVYPSPAWQATYAATVGASRVLARRMRREPCALTFALKAALVACDTVASGLVREGHSIVDWIEDVAHRDAIDGQRIREDIIDPRVASVAARTGKPFVFQAFQEGAARISQRSLLLAACGAGKTLAAWRWAEAQATARPVGRVVFLYPTRGTATEGFRDYVGWAPEGDSALVHGTSRYELDGMAQNPSESLRGKRLVDETDARLFALALWSKRYFSATVDQFFSFLENRYESLCLVPALADAVVVLDEVHSYDDRMYRNLLQFLDRLDCPVLAMTATLPPDRRKELGKRMEIYPRDEHRAELRDLERLEAHPRYRHRAVRDESEALAAALRALEEGLRVLWVVNVVRRAQTLTRALRNATPHRVLTYHSRFRLSDRQRAHRSVVDAFQADGSPVIAVTTQVCEMSLDLDADLLITEHAPIPSMVQRFGRANRHLRRGEEFRATLLTYPPESVLPYDEDELSASAGFLAALSGEPSQRELSEKLEQLAPRARATSADASAFFAGGYCAVPGDFRESESSGTSCVLDSDVDEVVAALAQRRPIDGFVLQVPRKHARPGPTTLARWLSIAPRALYDVDLGFVDEVN